MPTGENTALLAQCAGEGSLTTASGEKRPSPVRDDGPDKEGLPLTGGAVAPDGATEGVPRAADAPKPPAKKKPSAATLRRRKQALHRWLRYAIQLAFLLLAPGMFSGAFNGVKYIATQVGAIEGLELTSFVVLLIFLCAYTVVFGRFFCGYACAFGAAGDWLHALLAFVLGRFKLKIPALPEKLVRVLSLLKYVVLAAICVACGLGVWSTVSGWSPWVAFAGFTSASLDDIAVPAFVALGVLAVCMVLRERFFCQFLCPMGAVFSLLPVLGFSKFTRTPENCAKRCGRCQAGCPVDIWPDADTAFSGECIACGRCADTCPLGNVNLVAIEKEHRKRASGEDAVLEVSVSQATGASMRRKTRDAYYLLKGSGVGVVLVKAAVLLVCLWVLGSLRYVPSPEELAAMLGAAG